MPAPKPLGVVVLAYNRCEFTRRTVTSMLNHSAGDSDIVIADNASTDETPSLASLFGDRVRYVRLPENFGPDAVNRLWAEMPHPYLMRSDNDLDYKVGWDRRMVTVFEATPGLGGLTPMKYYASEEERQAVMFDAGGEPAWRDPSTLTSTLAIPRTLYDQGLRWRRRFPVEDAPFCRDIKAMGHTLASMDGAQNFGYNRPSIEKYPDYYRENFRLKLAAGAFGPGEKDRYLEAFPDLEQ